MFSLNRTTALPLAIQMYSYHHLSVRINSLQCPDQSNYFYFIKLQRILDNHDRNCLFYRELLVTFISYASPRWPLCSAVNCMCVCVCLFFIWLRLCKTALRPVLTCYDGRENPLGCQQPVTRCWLKSVYSHSPINWMLWWDTDMSHSLILGTWVLTEGMDGRTFWYSTCNSRVSEHQKSAGLGQNTILQHLTCQAPGKAMLV